MGRCARTADYLYSVYAPGVNGGEAAASDTYATTSSTDLKADPWQLNNVVADPAYARPRQTCARACWTGSKRRRDTAPPSRTEEWVCLAGSGKKTEEVISVLFLM